MSFISELSRRNVWRAAAAYVVTAWLVIQVVETIFPAFGFGDVAIRVVVILFAIGFIPAMVLAWVFEWTPEGFRRESEVDDTAPSSIATARRMDRMIMVILALGLAYFAVDKFVFDPARDEARVQQAAREAARVARSEALVDSYGDRSIAVLPFVNMSADADNEYFSDGISEELLNLLAKIPTLRVISRSSSFTFKGKDIDIPEIAAQLSVAFILEGSVRKAGERVRITAQLIEAHSDTHVWSETYDRTLDDIFAIQDEISSAIVAELRPRMGLDVEQVPVVTATTSNEAHDAYLRGQFLFRQRDIEGAVAVFREAVDLDPNYAPAQAGLALGYRFTSMYEGSDRDEAIAKAMPHARRAIELDPELPEAHAAMGYALLDPETYEQTIEHFRMAVQLNPNYADALIWLGQQVENTGEFAEAFELYERALMVDPLSSVAKINVIGSLIMRNRLDEARAENQKLKTLKPAWYQMFEIDFIAAGGNWAEAALAALHTWSADNWSFESEEALTLLGEIQVFLAAMGFPEDAMPLREEHVYHGVYRTLGRSSRIVELYENGSGDMRTRHDYALALAATEDYERALPELEADWEDWVKRTIISPWFTEYHALALQTARFAVGGETDSSDLIEAMDQYVSRRAEAGIVGGNLSWDVSFQAGVLKWLEGKYDEAITLIREAVERGYIVYPNEAYLQDLYDHPGFAEILEIQRQRQESERGKFLSVVCKDNPYAELWSPPEGSCRDLQ